MDEKVLDEFYKIITPNKVEMFDRIAPLRTKYLTVVMENIHQEHNASAVLRSCDCFGIQELHVIEKDNEYLVQRDIALGAGRWVDMHTYDNENTATADCIQNLKSQGYKIVATTPRKDSRSITELDLSQPIALVFGTERKGISDEVIEMADEFVTIPMYGFTESFNISVSVAIILNTLRQRLENSEVKWRLSEREQMLLKIEWCKRILNGGPEMDTHFRKLIAEDKL
ncbi:MAG: RNA methyltransferase [Crocinitomicaceae bacterium]|nr:RNA methyltransferase [Crocinitomicaceae bacterium]